jgi:MinD superfamily P-loop ATPase
MDINWTTHRNTQANPIPGGVGATLTQEVCAGHCVCHSVCDWNLIMMRSDSPVPYQCSSTQTILNA